MHELGFWIKENNTGAPAYRPQLKLKIYIYGYLNRIRSSRRLERECKRNLELMWLTEGLAPDFKTIADFRRDNSTALIEVFREFLGMCRRLDLLEFKTVAIDGTKMRGQNSGNEIYRKDTIEEVELKIHKRIDEYISELDKLDEYERTKRVRENPEQIERLTTLLEKQQKGRIRRRVLRVRAGKYRRRSMRTRHLSMMNSRISTGAHKIKSWYE